MIICVQKNNKRGRCVAVSLIKQDAVRGLLYLTLNFSSFSNLKDKQALSVDHLLLPVFQQVPEQKGSNWENSLQYPHFLFSFFFLILDFICTVTVIIRFPFTRSEAPFFFYLRAESCPFQFFTCCTYSYEVFDKNNINHFVW